MLHKQILDAHQQLRQMSCFQMAPELALKLAGILVPTEFPFQNHPWDEKGYEPYNHPHTVEKHIVQFSTLTFEHPYDGMIQRLHAEIDNGTFPVVSLRSAPNHPWHGYVAFEKDGDNDCIIGTKKGCVDDGNCESQVDNLSSKLVAKEKVDCLFWSATISN